MLLVSLAVKEGPLGRYSVLRNDREVGNNIPDVVNNSARKSLVHIWRCEQPCVSIVHSAGRVSVRSRRWSGLSDGCGWTVTGKCSWFD